MQFIAIKSNMLERIKMFNGSSNTLSANQIEVFILSSILTKHQLLYDSWMIVFKDETTTLETTADRLLVIVTAP